MSEYVGVDVGGTKVLAGTLTDGFLGETYTEPTALDHTEALIDQLVGIIRRVAPPGAQAVGIGVPSVIEFATGRIRHSVNIPLQDVPLRALLTERVGMPVFVENDANCAALAEAYLDGKLVCRDLVMFTVGTGVGGGLVLNGRLYRGATGAAPEMGHTLIGLDLRDGVPEPAERWPQPGSLEDLAAGTELDELAQRVAREHPDSALGRLVASDSAVTGVDAVKAATAGDPEAQHLVRLLGGRLGIGIANAINMFDPLEVVIGGGVSAAGEMLLGPAREAAAKYTVPGVGTQTQIRLARHGADAGVIGAALIAEQEVER